MTDPINPWLDANELKQLAESLMQSPGQIAKPAAQDAGFGDSFVGFAVEQEFSGNLNNYEITGTIPESQSFNGYRVSQIFTGVRK